MARQVLPVIGAAIGGWITGGSAAGIQWGCAIGSEVADAHEPLLIKSDDVKPPAEDVQP